MELLIALWLVVAGTVVHGYQDGIIKDDTRKETVLYERERATNPKKIAKLDRIIADNGWQQPVVK